MTQQTDTPREFGRPAFADLSDELDVADPELTVDDGAESDLDVIERELAAEVAAEVTFPIDARPGWAARFRTDFDGKQIDAWRKQARDRKFTDGVDGIKFASILLASTMTALLRNDVVVELDGKGPTTVTTRELQAMLKTSGALATVRKLYGTDGLVDAAARSLMAEAGWGSEVAAAQDPR